MRIFVCKHAMRYFLGVIPNTSGVGHVNGKHESRSNTSDKHSAEGFRTKEETTNERSAHGKSSWDNHFPKRSFCGDLVASSVVGFANGAGPLCKVILFKLTANLTFEYFPTYEVLRK